MKEKPKDTKKDLKKAAPFKSTSIQSFPSTLSIAVEKLKGLQRPLKIQPPVQKDSQVKRLNTETITTSIVEGQVLQKTEVLQMEAWSPSLEKTTTEVLVGPSGPTEAGIHSVLDGIGCPQEFKLRHVRKIRIPQLQTPDAFAVGSQVHAGKARWFSRGFATDQATWASIQDAMRKEMEDNELPVSKKALQMGERYMNEYIQHWKLRPKPLPIACEYKLGPTPLEPGDAFFTWRTARLDDVSRYPEALNKLCLGETKTTSDSIKGCILKYKLHPQILLQMVLWKNDPNGEAKYGPIAGVMLDVIKKGYGEDKSSFAREFIEVPRFAMTWFPRTLKAHLRLLAQIDWDTPVVRNPTRCTRQEGRALIECEFNDLCLKGRDAANKYVMGKGNSLLSFKPELGKTNYPWE